MFIVLRVLDFARTVWSGDIYVCIFDLAAVQYVLLQRTSANPRSTLQFRPFAGERKDQTHVVTDHPLHPELAAIWA
jgi:hypothetical protein